MTGVGTVELLKVAGESVTELQGVGGKRGSGLVDARKGIIDNDSIASLFLRYHAGGGKAQGR